MEIRVVMVLPDPLVLMVILADKVLLVQEVLMAPLVFREKTVQMAMKDLLVKMGDQVKPDQKVPQVLQEEVELVRLVLQEVQVVLEQMEIQVVMVTEVKTAKMVRMEAVVPMVNLVHAEKMVNQDDLVNLVDLETAVKLRLVKTDLPDPLVLQECQVSMAKTVKTVPMANMVSVDHPVDVENQAKMAAEVMMVSLDRLVDVA